MNIFFNGFVVSIPFLQINRMPAISVIIPTYNRRVLLVNAVESVLRQSLDDWELLIIDDASEDGTANLKLFREHDPRIRLERLDMHCGVSAARNRGVALSRGAWICFLDSDDIWHVDKLKKQTAWHEANPSYRISQTQEIWVRNGVRVNPPKTHEKLHGFQFMENLQRCMITPSSVMIEKKLFNKVGGFNETLPVCEDYDLWLRITSVYPVGLIDERLMTRLGGHEDQLSASLIGIDRFRIRSILDILKMKTLTDKQKTSARRILVQKASILANGFKKRGNSDECEHYSRIAACYAQS